MVKIYGITYWPFAYSLHGRRSNCVGMDSYGDVGMNSYSEYARYLYIEGLEEVDW